MPLGNRTCTVPPRTPGRARATVCADAGAAAAALTPTVPSAAETVARTATTAPYNQPPRICIPLLYPVTPPIGLTGYVVPMPAAGERFEAPAPAFLFDLDGTLIDSVYQHVTAWQEALSTCGIELSVWRIHRRIGMSGGLFLHALQRETGRTLDAQTLARVSELHRDGYMQRAGSVVPLPGARELLATLRDKSVPFAVATSGDERVASAGLSVLRLPESAPVITRDQVHRAKPDPDLFLAAAERLGVDPHQAFVVGDSVWDLLAAQRAGALGVGLLSGGYGPEELQAAGAYRVYSDPADLLAHLEEVGVRPER